MFTNPLDVFFSIADRKYIYICPASHAVTLIVFNLFLRKLANFSYITGIISRNVLRTYGKR